MCSCPSRSHVEKAPDPADRPTMDVVVDRLEKCLTDIAIDDK